MTSLRDEMRLCNRPVKLLVTGATSFIGSHFVDYVLANTHWEILSLERLPDPFLPSRSRVKQLFHDLRAEAPQRIVEELKSADYLVHFAADVSGLKSLANPVLSVTTNVVGTFNVLELARKLSLKKFVFISTGEAVGAAVYPDVLAENTPLRPSNPYAASKAAAEALVSAYRVSFGVPSIIVRSMNVFGPGQQVARFIPTVIKNLLQEKKVVCHVDKSGRSGSRNWLHVDHFSATLKHVLDFGEVGETYHLVGPEKTNAQVIRLLAAALGKHPQIENIIPGPSHDLRYALKDTKLGLNFEDLEESLCQTAFWYQRHPEALA